jgi:hypothetical protein
MSALHLAGWQVVTMVTAVIVITPTAPPKYDYLKCPKQGLWCCFPTSRKVRGGQFKIDPHLYILYIYIYIHIYIILILLL